MLKEEIFQVMSQVLTSWQVIVVSIVLILFLNLVFYAARAYHSPRASKINVKGKIPKTEQTEVNADDLNIDKLEEES
jgi:hypothetical protein